MMLCGRSAAAAAAAAALAALGALIVALGAPATAVARGPARFLAGAGSADTTPPASGGAAAAAADGAFAPRLRSCSSALFRAAGRFALQEPFDDLNGTGLWDAGLDLAGGPDGRAPDPWCDANLNARWDGIYADNGRGPATGVNDPIGVRAVAISDGRDLPVVYASVDAIGLFDAYTDQARYDLLHTYGVHASLVVSADHNESSPDTIGLYGALQTPLGVSARSGIDEYYMDFLADRIAHAAATAVHALRPAGLYANQVEGAIARGQSGSTYPLLTGLTQHISDQFPTSVALPHDDRVAAVDPKLGVLQARDRTGRPIFTVISLAAHNQEMGNSGPMLSGDWPGAMQRAFDTSHPGMSIFLVADNGSEEDPQTDPVVVPKGSENHSSVAVQYTQARATGERVARVAAAAARRAVKLSPGPVRLIRRAICVPLENNGFVALAAAGVFGRRQAWSCDRAGDPVRPVPNGGALPTLGAQFRTFVGYADIGPDLQLLDLPGEAFPALALGSPFGAEEESCDRPNPAVPVWHARATFRFEVGLADDLIGYLIPAWGFASGTPGLFSNDGCYQDAHGHRHKLESESVGPTGSNDVANVLSSMLASEPDPSAHIVSGRYLLASGAPSRWPQGAAGMLIAGSGSTLEPASGLMIGDPRTRAFGRRAIDAHGLFMDFDGQPQARADVTTRGMILLGPDGCVAARYYLSVFPPLAIAGPAGAARRGRSRIPARRCRSLSRGAVPELQPGAAAAAGLR